MLEHLGMHPRHDSLYISRGGHRQEYLGMIPCTYLGVVTGYNNFACILVHIKGWSEARIPRHNSLYISRGGHMLEYLGMIPCTNLGVVTG